ncbi:MAG: hypothetical protein NUV54_00595 [Candidatus Taylorbacteria bacterium]|nr:hypothetical protein [Candidatus Taylorbacteria bacterium]
MKPSLPPRQLTDVGLNMFVDTVKLRELNLPIIDVPLERLLWHFDMPIWAKDNTDDWNLTPWEVIRKKVGTSVHRERVAESNLAYPIIVTEYNGRLVILDGVHRLVKAHENGRTSIQAKLIPTDFLSLTEFQS